MHECTRFKRTEKVVLLVYQRFNGISYPHIYVEENVTTADLPKQSFILDENPGNVGCLAAVRIERVL